MAVCSCGFQQQTLAKRQDAASTNDILSTSTGLDSNYRDKH